MTPAFLEDQLQRSLRNLGLTTIDIFYLLNPETRLRFVSCEAFDQRCPPAFEKALEKLERLARAGHIQYYGIATWGGYRKNGAANSLSLIRLARIAEEVAGSNHHFRFVQLLFHMAIPEAYAQQAGLQNGKRTIVLDAAGKLEITVIASPTLLQTRLLEGQPSALAGSLGLPSAACRAIQYTQPAPGISVALAGMGNAGHVRENLQVAARRALSSEQFSQLTGR